MIVRLLEGSWEYSNYDRHWPYNNIQNCHCHKILAIHKYVLIFDKHLTLRRSLLYYHTAEQYMSTIHSHHWFTCYVKHVKPSTYSTPWPFCVAQLPVLVFILISNNLFTCLLLFPIYLLTQAHPVVNLCSSKGHRKHSGHKRKCTLDLRLHTRVEQKCLLSSPTWFKAVNSVMWKAMARIETGRM